MKKKKKKWDKVFCFWDNCTWIGCVQLSLLTRWCLSSTANVLTNSLTILCITKEPFSNATTCTVINKYNKGAVIQIATLFRPIFLVVCLRILWNTAFQTFIWLCFSEPVFPEIHQHWGSLFFWQMFKIWYRF